MSSSDTLPTYRGVLNDTTWSDASALAFPADAIVGVYVQAFTPVVTLDSNFLSLTYGSSTTNAPYTHGTLDVDYTSTTSPPGINRQLNWANLVRSFLRSQSPITFTSVTAGSPYTKISFSWPTLATDQLVLADATNGIKTLAIGAAHQFLYGGGASPAWAQPALSDLSGLPVPIASGGTGITTAPSANQVPYASSSTAYSYVSLNASATKMFLRQVSSGAPTFAQVDYYDLSNLPSLPSYPLSVTNGGTGVSTAPSTNQVPYASSSTAYSYVSLNTTATNKFLRQVSSATPAFAQVDYNDLSSLPSLPSYPLSVANGGTGASSWTQYLLMYANTTGSFSQIPIGTSGQYLKSAGAGAAPSFADLPTAVTITGASANRVTVSGGPAYTLSAPQDIHTAADVQFGYLSIGTARSATQGNVIANTISATGAAPFGMRYSPTLTRSDASTSYGWYHYTTFNVGATAGGTVYNMYLDTGVKTGAGSITNAVNLFVSAPLAATNGLACQFDSLAVGYGPWTDPTTASGTIKTMRLGLSQNPDATKVLVATGDSKLTGTLEVTSTVTLSGLPTAYSLVATDGSKNLTNTTSGLTPQFTGVTFGGSTLSKYQEVTGATVTVTYNGGTVTMTYDYIVHGKVVTMNIRAFSFTTNSSAAAQAYTAALPSEIRPARNVFNQYLENTTAGDKSAECMQTSAGVLSFYSINGTGLAPSTAFTIYGSITYSLL